MPRPKQRTDQLRENGVAAAMALLSEEGVAGFTTRALARRTDASLPAVYEVFGDKAGLIREVFFEGFRQLSAELAAIPVSGVPLEDVRSMAEGHRRFVVSRPVLAEVMFSRPFADFDPSTAEAEAGARVRRLILDRVRAAVESGALSGDATDIAHVFVALIQGLAAAEASQRLGRGRASVDRRWALALDAMFRGLAPGTTAGHRATRGPRSSRR